MPDVRQDRVRLVILLHRKESMNVDDFQEYWRNEHSQVFSSIAVVKKNLLSYEQAHGNSEALEQLKQVGFPVAEADGMAIFEAVSYEKIFECFTDDEYKKVVVPDEEKFLDRGKSLAFPAGIVNVFDDPT
ncbi:hypothetical protein MMC28_009346 [Mycoblastus sanguinarius]|nr:hypothetical protein [Mycoblastus sanguinarius]